MTTLAASSADTSRRDAKAFAGWGLWLALLWLPFLWRLTPVWSGSVEQSYGWAVPVLVCFFTIERLRWMPSPSRGERVGERIAWGGVIAGLTALPVLLTVLEANPTWPTAQWATYAALGLVTLGAVAAMGGTQQMRHLAFPVIFMATALTWPATVSTRVANVLGELNAQFAAAVVSAAGYPAVVSGRVIEVAGGWVGIDEACSGLRSLQAAAMAGLFFGEMFLLSRLRRVRLLVAALVVAIVANAIRMTALTWIAAADSIAASARWHDRAGGFELAGTLAGIALLAFSVGRKVRHRPRPTGETLPRLARAKGFLLSAAALAALTPVAWYGVSERRQAQIRTQWALVPPDAAWAEFESPPRAQALLQASSIDGLVRNEPGGGRAYAVLVRWDGAAGRDFAGQDHDPSICLPASGRAADVLPDTRTIAVHETPIDFTVARFEADGRRHHVYYCHWDVWLARARVSDAANIPRWRLARVREGRRRSDAAYLAFVVPSETPAEADAWLARWAPRLLRRE